MKLWEPPPPRACNTRKNNDSPAVASPSISPIIAPQTATRWRRHPISRHAGTYSPNIIAIIGSYLLRGLIGTQIAPYMDMKPLSTGTIGALRELIVCADLLERGYCVFRSMSPACPCDLIAYKSITEIRRIEVRTIARTLEGQAKSIPLERADVLAGMFGRRIRYYDLRQGQEVLEP